MDPDSVSKGTTVFKLVDIYPHGTNRSFSVSADGKIKTSMKLDREEQNRYVLTLFAEDHSSRGQIQRTTFCVVVHVKDANDHKPRFVAMSSLRNDIIKCQYLKYPHGNTWLSS